MALTFKRERMEENSGFELARTDRNVTSAYLIFIYQSIDCNQISQDRFNNMALYNTRF